MYTGTVCTFVSIYSSLYNLDTLGELYVPLMRVLTILGLNGCPERLGRFFPVIPVVAGLLQDYEAGASFSFSLPRVILHQRQARPAFAGLFHTALSLTRASSRRKSAIRKKRNLIGCACLWCDPDRIRTCDPQLRRLLLYPAELPDHSLKKWVQI